jgi:hypothetical protein
MIVPRSLFRCGFAIEPIPRLDDEIGVRARSARVGNTLCFPNIPGIFKYKSALIALPTRIIHKKEGETRIIL